ncbi:MAG: type IV secretory system conjugative DNA transfer family protein [Patescibacteria group bacterium]
MLYLLLIIIVIVVALALFFVSRSLRKNRLSQALDLKLLLVKLPRGAAEGEKKDFKDEINLSAQLFSILAGLKNPFTLEAAVHHAGAEISFYIGVPALHVQSISRQIEGLFKDAQVTQIDDYNIFIAGGENIGVYLKQKFHSALPLRTYAEANVDTFAPILNSLSKISEVGEGAAIQILVKPAPSSIKKSAVKMIANLKKGAKLENLLGGMKIGLSDFQKALAGPQKEKEEKVVEEESIKALEGKISKPIFAVNFRIAASATNSFQAESVLNGITQGFSQFSAPLRQEIKPNKPKNPARFFYQFSFREYDDEQNMYLNSEELASLFHFPISTTEAPRVKWLKSREAAPPVNLLKTGTMTGVSIFRGEEKPVFIADEDRRRHVYTIGQTGTGKSTMLVNMAIDDIKKGKGVAIVDPHGDLIEKILSLMPQNRIDDVIVFDPADLWKPLGMNMLEYDLDKPEQKTFIVNEMFSILDKLYDMKTAGGPMFEQYTKNAILLLMEDMKNEPATLMEIARVFTDDAFRQKKLSRISNPVVVDFWTKEAAAATGEHSLANMSSYITSKFSNFTANDYMRPIIGQAKSAFNFRKVMDEGKILLISLSKGKIGDINANLLGMVIIGKILMAAFSRVDLPQEQRRDFNLYIDEFQNFTTDSISMILSEARKYALNLTMAHQFIAQLTEKIRDAVFGNVGSKIVFRVGVQDAEFLEKEFAPDFTKNDLINIDNFNAYAKILINGQTSTPFNIRTISSESGDKALVDKIKELSRAKYSRDRQEVEEEILKRLRN